MCLFARSIWRWSRNVNTYIPFSRSSSVHRPFHSLTYLSICSLGFICRRVRCFLIYVAYSFILILPVSIFALHCPSSFSMSHTSLAHVFVTPSHPTPSSHSLLSVCLLVPHSHHTPSLISFFLAYLVLSLYLKRPSALHIHTHIHIHTTLTVYRRCHLRIPVLILILVCTLLRFQIVSCLFVRSVFTF